jgi:hypothetical protein
MRRIALFFAAALSAAGVTARAEDGPAPAPREASPVDRVAWQLEEVTVEGGRVYLGLVLSEGRDELEFVEVVRPPGQPMYLVVRPIRRAAVVSTRRLPPAERSALVERIDKVRNRALIEAGRMEDVALDEEAGAGSMRRRYEGRWFTLFSTADDETTRRAVVRVEQIFRAYRQFLPPRSLRTRPLAIELYGSMEEYRAALRSEGIELDSAAYYNAAENRIVAGSELALFGERLARTRARHEEIRRSCEAVQAGLPQALAEIAARLRAAGTAEKAIAAELVARRAAWERQYKQKLAEIAAADRRNEAQFAEVTAAMFTRLYHEALHAYVENYLYSGDRFHVPRWLHEGLAQVFESGQLDADTLRIDAPHPAALAELKKDLAEGAPWSLAEMLAAPDRSFLVTHGDGGSSRRNYACAWGLAYYLVFQRDLLAAPAWDEYVSADAAKMPAVARFERLVEEPLPEFERQWRAYVKSLKPRP